MLAAGTTESCRKGHVVEWCLAACEYVQCMPRSIIKGVTFACSAGVLAAGGAGQLREGPHLVYLPPALRDSCGKGHTVVWCAAAASQARSTSAIARMTSFTSVDTYIRLRTCAGFIHMFDKSKFASVDTRNLRTCMLAGIVFD